jgi:hypothetical protein
MMECGLWEKSTASVVEFELLCSGGTGCPKTGLKTVVHGIVRGIEN